MALGLDTLSKASAKARMAERGEQKIDIDGATALFEEAEQILINSGTLIYFPELHLEMARFGLSREMHSEAERRVDMALYGATAYGMPLYQADAYLLRAEISLSSGNHEDAESAFHDLNRAAAIIERHGYGRRQADLQRITDLLPSWRRDYRNYLLRLITDWQDRDVAKVAGRSPTLGARIRLADVYVAPPLVQPDVRPGSDAFQQTQPNSVGDLSHLVNDTDSPFTLIIAAPGGGKSTLVDQLAAESASALVNSQDSEIEDARWPIRIQLWEAVGFLRDKTNYVDVRMIWRLVRFVLGVERVPSPVQDNEPLTRQGLFLFDGLDEIPEDDGMRQRFCEALAEFAETLGPSAQVLVTARPYALEEASLRRILHRFRLLTIAPLDLERIGFFIDRFFLQAQTALGWEDAFCERHSIDLKWALRSRTDLAELARNPLLLTLIANIRLTRTRLPQDRADLYEEIIDLMLSHRHRIRDRPTSHSTTDYPTGLLRSDIRAIRNRIHALAYRIHVHRKPIPDQVSDDANAGLSDSEILNLFSTPLLGHDYFTPMSLLRFLDQRAGLLIRGKDGLYDFRHLALREYLAACFLVDNEEDLGQRLVELVRENPGWWSEVFLLAVHKASHVNMANALGIITRLLPSESEEKRPLEDGEWRNIALAARAIVELRAAELSPDQPFAQKMLDDVSGWACRLIEEGHLSAVELAKIADDLAQLGDPRPGVGLDQAGLPDILWVALPEGKLPIRDGRGSYLVDVDPFDIARFPVTVAQYAAYLNAKHDFNMRKTGEMDSESKVDANTRNVDSPSAPRTPPIHWNEQVRYPTRPVVGVTWAEAVAYCRWLSEVRSEVVRLPSELEWQYAAQDKTNRRFPWGSSDENAVEQANTAGSGMGGPTPVGIYPLGSTPEGVMDLAGNVWEWCCDRFEEPWHHKQSDCDNEDTPGDRAVRGGSWSLGLSDATCASRQGFRPKSRNMDVGFRPVRVRSGEPEPDEATPRSTR